MKIYKDIFTDDELCSDSFPMSQHDGIVLEFKGKHVVRKHGEIVLTGANPSADGDIDEGSEEFVERGIDIVLNHQLVEIDCYRDPGAFKAYIKEFLKKLVNEMTKNGKSEKELNEFRKKAQTWVVSLLSKERFKNLAFFVGENMSSGKAEGGQVAIVEYRDEAEGEVPYLMLIEAALIEEKC